MTVKFYAVKAGRKPGIYKNWEECKKQVEAFSGAVYKSFKTREEAKSYISGKADDGNEEENTCDVKDNLIAYVDGSFFEGESFGSGCVIIYKGAIKAEISEKYTDMELAKMRNVAGEIKAAELAMRYALDNGYKEICIYHDYEGIARWCLGEWKAGKPGTIAYKKFYDKITENIKVSFVKVKGHSGNEYNDLADLLAKKALEI